MYSMMNWFGRNFVETRVGPLDNTTRHCRLLTAIDYWALTVLTLWVNGLLEMLQFHWWRLCFHFLADAHECISFNCATGICIFLALSPCFKLLRINAAKLRCGQGQSFDAGWGCVTDACQAKTWALIQLPLLVMGESFLCWGRPLRVAVRATADDTANSGCIL